MLTSAVDLAWAAASVILLGIVIAGFLVSWLLTEVLAVGRQRYIGVLAVTTAGLTAATIALTETDTDEFFAHSWGWGVLGALVTGAIVGTGIRQTPATLHRTGRELHEAEAWEGVVYGISAGLLLSALPAFVAWQAAHDAGWNAAASWAVALAASAVVIAVHHFGYRDYRSPLVLEVLAGCLILTVGYLATGSVVAPVLGHVIMHIAGVTKGVELPPHRTGGLSAA